MKAVANKDKSHCKWGHEFSIENTKRRRDGTRECRTCVREIARAWNNYKRKR